MLVSQFPAWPARPVDQQDDTPHVNGMGAFEGVANGFLWRQKLAKNASILLADLHYEDFLEIVAAEIRNRPFTTLERVIDRVTK